MKNKIRGAIYGLLIGDAVGVPYEFNLPEQLPHFVDIDMIPPKNFSRTYPDIPVGTWSDDGAQALCLLASLLHCQKLDPIDLMNRIANWYQFGYMAPDYHVFDVGVQTATAIRQYLQGTPIMQVAIDDEHANGNGALMRVLPLALWHQGADEALILAAYLQSHITHAHLRSKVCCALYCLWARYILKGMTINTAWSHAVTILRGYCGNRPDELEQLEFFIRPDDLEKGTGSGYVVDCLKSAYLALQESSYQAVIKKAISLGRDTDTTACVAGGLAGLAFGDENIPPVWLQQLRAKEMVEPLLTQLIDG
ncbi:ADP-ribosylglycohydrolase family protein [Acinetobacter sp. 1000160]|uniref:ADP-ribosylglycohydrolase family protein n=1 Tax=Acinetobacter sp. 1000160 TaxID=1310800 RepID=UPI00044EA16C|nr:ADP-ribosylglycohydrolase family protein [Acinetobacter sp. 1000160]EXB49239.1 ADP-ribosylglycohydrolase family protein [Acinetobacter baumannii 146457]EYT21751.1 ADP-ribosylglycohydrolase family protein [Acinetobacter sp. 1000160]